MYVLCTLAVLTLHNLIKNRNKPEQSQSTEAAGLEGRRKDGGAGDGCWGTSGPRDRVDGSMNHRAEGRRRRGDIRNLPNGRRHVQVRRRSGSGSVRFQFLKILKHKNFKTSLGNGGLTPNFRRKYKLLVTFSYIFGECESALIKD